MTNLFSGKPAKRSTQEFRLQCAVVEHLRSAFPQVLFTHPAQKAKDAQEGHFNKMLGVRKGVPDLLLWWNKENLGYPRIMAAAIELKSGAGKQSGYQANFEEIFTRIGGKHAYCRSVQEAHDALISWGCEAKHGAIREPDLRSQQEKFSDAYDLYDPRNYLSKRHIMITNEKQYKISKAQAAKFLEGIVNRTPVEYHASMYANDRVLMEQEISNLRAYCDKTVVRCLAQVNAYLLNNTHIPSDTLPDGLHLPKGILPVA